MYSYRHATNSPYVGFRLIEHIKLTFFLLIVTKTLHSTHSHTRPEIFASVSPTRKMEQKIKTKIFRVHLWESDTYIDTWL